MTIELARDSVLPWECDRNDHLNMQFYVGRASNALSALGVVLGIGPQELVRRGQVLTEVETHIRNFCANCAAARPSRSPAVLPMQTNSSSGFFSNS